jgi:hypothetical protein
MGAIQDRVLEGAMAQLDGKLKDTLLEFKKQNEQVINIMEQVKDVLKEMQLVNRNNDVWVMETLQSICDKLDMKLKDPMETNNG